MKDELSRSDLLIRLLIWCGLNKIKYSFVGLKAQPTKLTPPRNQRFQSSRKGRILGFSGLLRLRS